MIFKRSFVNVVPFLSLGYVVLHRNYVFFHSKIRIRILKKKKKTAYN